METFDTRPAVRPFTTAEGAQIFQLPVEAFPDFWVHAYLVLVGKYCVLIDAGSGFGKANDHLDEGLQEAGDRLGRKLTWPDLTHVLITHAHIDHFGGLSYLRKRMQARVGIHELDQRSLIAYEERLVVIARRLDRYLIEAGVSTGARTQLMGLYNFTKALFHSVGVDFTYEATGMRLGPFEFLHVPGHCAGHVVIRLHDVLFSGDHVLQGISPHQAPESLTLFTGLDHYLRSLEKLKVWCPHVRLTLGGHHEPVEDLCARIDAILELHQERLARVQELLSQPQTIAEVSRALFGEVSGYNVLLAIEEAGAHVEYLYQRGMLAIANLSDLDGNQGPVPVRYVSRSRLP